MDTAIQVFEQVKSSAEAIKSSLPQRFPAAASAGDYWRQGDLYITLREACPDGCVSISAEKQLAPGTTMGSRHVLDSLAGVEVFRLAEPTALDGPILKLGEERTITHPEHGDVICPPGVYQITYQRAFAKELRRVAD